MIDEETISKKEGAADILRNNIDIDDTHKYYLLTVEFGIKAYSAYLEWCEDFTGFLHGHCGLRLQLVFVNIETEMELHGKMLLLTFAQRNDY